MKTRYLKLLLLLPLIVFLVSGCGISNDSIRNALNNEENCLKACHEMEDKALADLENCLAQCTERFNADFESCNNGHLIPPDNPMLCLRRANDRFTACKEECFKAYRTKLEEVRKCRKDCRDKFPLEIKLK